jgi:methyl coenzyme M reductase gamma subunit
MRTTGWLRVDDAFATLARYGWRGARVEAVPLRFDEEGSLIAALRGVDTL